jgi:hypothetical protein
MRTRSVPRCAPSSACSLLTLPFRGPHPVTALNFSTVSFSGFGSSMENEMSEEARRKWDRRSAEFRQRALEQMKTCLKGAGERARSGAAAVVLVEAETERRQKPSEPGAIEEPRDRRIRELEKKVAELEGVIGKKTLELDFFAGALRRIEESRRKRDKSGATASTPKSAGGCNRKVD